MGLENFSKINKRGGTIIRYLRVPCDKVTGCLKDCAPFFGCCEGVIASIDFVIIY